MAFSKGEISYEIIKKLAALNEMPSGWTKEVNIVSWNGNDPKVDIRDWNSDHTKMGKGITLMEDEAKALSIALKERFDV